MQRDRNRATEVGKKKSKEHGSFDTRKIVSLGKKRGLILLKSTGRLHNMKTEEYA